MIKIFTTETCPTCKIIKDLMDKNGIEYKVIDMQTPSGKTELAMKGLFPMSAPVLFVGDKVFESEYLSGMNTKDLLALIQNGE